VGSGVAFIVLSTIAVVLRLLTSSQLTERKLAADDWWILITLFLFYGTVVNTFYGVFAGGGGQDITSPTFNFAKETIFLKSLFIYTPTYSTTVTACKISILCFYRRIFSVGSFPRQSLIVGIVVVVWWMTSFIGTFTTCQPIAELWNPLLPGNCFNFNAFFLAMTIIELFIDATILVLPVRMLTILQLSRRDKYTVGGIFLLGGFVIITGIIRIHFTYVPHSNFVSFTESALWIHIHVGTAIICACLPTFRPLIAKFWLVSKSFRQRYAGLFSSLRSRRTKSTKGSGADGSETEAYKGPNSRYGLVGAEGDGVCLTDVQSGPYTGSQSSIDKGGPMDSVMVRKTIEVV